MTPEHRDEMERRADSVLDEERFERGRRATLASGQGWEVQRSDDNSFVFIRVNGPDAPRWSMDLDLAVAFANSILAECEIAQRSLGCICEGRGYLPHQTYGDAWPAGSPPDGTQWVSVQRCDYCEVFEGDLDAAKAFIEDAHSPRGAVFVSSMRHGAETGDYFVAVPLAWLEGA